MQSHNVMNIYYISIEGNTKHFVTKMKNLFHNIELHRITDQSDFVQFKKPFFVFIPTYVKGTQEDPTHLEKQAGENFGIQEIDTLTMNDELGYKKNYRNCLGLIGSGNRNFGEDCYCWTALHYHRKYHIPVLDNYEIRGTMNDENRINKRLVQVWNEHTKENQHVKINKLVNSKPTRLEKLEKKYGK